MPASSVRSTVSAFAIVATSVAFVARAGPPYATDDPEPVPLGHWEVYVASHLAVDAEGTSGTLPHVEANYGAAAGLQLHALVPAAFATGAGGFAFGLGDVELGAKYRFFDEGPWRPELGAFPLIELPTGSPARGLGDGAELVLPLWLQKSWGPWTSYGGGGWWQHLDRSGGHALVGLLVQREVARGVAVGVEGYWQQADPDGDAQAFVVDVGVVWDVTEHQHLLVSAGRASSSAVTFQDYIGWQWTS